MCPFAYGNGLFKVLLRVFFIKLLEENVDFCGVYLFLLW